jgi:hypothetical protein
MGPADLYIEGCGKEEKRGEGRDERKETRRERQERI